MFKESVLKKGVAVTVLSVSVLVMAATDGCVSPNSAGEHSWSLQECMSNVSKVSFIKPSSEDYKKCHASFTAGCATYQGKPWLCNNCYPSPDTCVNNLEYFIGNSKKVTVSNKDFATLCQNLIFNEAMDNCYAKQEYGGRSGKVPKGTSYHCDKSQYSLSDLNKALDEWCDIAHYTCYDN